MAMLTTDAKIYIARVIGGAGNTNAIDMAGEALLRGYEDWQAARQWYFLLKDTSGTTAVAACTATASSATVNAPSTGAFDFVNVGQGVTLISSTATLVSTATVSSITRNSDGMVASITLSDAFGGTTDTEATLTFSADIPVLAGVRDYNLPNDFNSSGTVRFLEDPKGYLAYTDFRYWDRYEDDHTVEKLPEGYMIYNPVSFATQNYGNKRMRIVGLPSASNTARMKYFRNFITNGTYVDMPNEYLYKFLDYCRGLLLVLKAAQDSPQDFVSSTSEAFTSAQQNDAEPDEDEEQRIISPYERMQTRPIVGNGPFDPFPNI